MRSDRKGLGLLSVLLTVLILALLAGFLLNALRPSENNQSSNRDTIQQAQDVVDQANNRVNQYE